MADFRALATRFVLADEESEQKQLAGEAAEAIKKAPRKSSAVLNWAQSINPWMPGGRAGGDDDAEGDIIARAKALGFLAATLEVLDPDVLRVEQVEHLIAFFGAMFGIDHKAGILAGATALQCLCAMTHFRPPMAASVLEHLTKLGDDFRLQTVATRLAMYDLVNRLLADEAVLSELQQAYGPSCGFLVELLQLCRHERDPDNLLRWFAILQTLLARYDRMTVDVAEEVFKAVSDYFPISMRSAVTPAGTTVDDLKTALRSCFAASGAVSGSVFDFLLQRLDQGDALTMSVKVDILQTMHACVETFPRPAQSVAPHTSRIWNSLKYEVRNGEVPETIDWTLRVLQAIAARLAGTSAEPVDAVYARDFCNLVLADCINDLGAPTYTKQAGQLLTSILRGGRRPFNLVIGSILTAVKQNLQKAQTGPHLRDLLAFLGDVLRTRQRLVDAEVDSEEGKGSSALAKTTLDEFHGHDTSVLGLLDGVYLSLWDGSANKQSQDPIVLAQIMNGLAELVGQRGPANDSAAGSLLCSPQQCMGVFTTLAPRAQFTFSWETASEPENFQELAHEAMLALKTATLVYPEGLGYLVGRLVSSIKAASLEYLSPTDLAGLKDTLYRLTFIGCSAIPTIVLQNDRLCHFVTVTHALYAILEWPLDKAASFQLANAVLSGIYSAMLNIRDAFAARGGKADVSPALRPVFQTYLTESMTLVRQLYLRATANAEGGISLSADFAASSLSAPSVDERDQYLHQLSSMATFVVRDLDGEEQISEKLHEALFSLFHSGPVNTSIFHDCEGGRVDVLSLGILRGLRPVAVAHLADIPASPQSLLEDLDVLGRLPQRTVLVRNSISAILANKYSASASAQPGNLAVWQTTVEVAKTRLDDPALTASQFGRLVAIAAGAFARLDKDAKTLAPLLAAAPAKHAASGGDKMARSLGLLASVGADGLSTDDHAVVKSIYRQWVYGQTVKRLLPAAFPKRADTTGEAPSLAESSVNTIAILALVRHMPFSVYEEDVEEPLVRILVAAVTTLPHWADVATALRVLYVVLENQPETLQGHLKTLVDASIGTFQVKPADQTNKSAAPRHGVPTPGCRKQALRLVARFPAQFEEGLLMAYSAQLGRALAAACGDRVREIRETAQMARESWVKVSL